MKPGPTRGGGHLGSCLQASGQHGGARPSSGESDDSFLAAAAGLRAHPAEAGVAECRVVPEQLPSLDPPESRPRGATTLGCVFKAVSSKDITPRGLGEMSSDSQLWGESKEPPTTCTHLWRPSLGAAGAQALGCRDEAWLCPSHSLWHLQTPPRGSLCPQMCLLLRTSLPWLIQSCCLMSSPSSHEHHPHSSCPGWKPPSPAWPPSSLCRRAGGTRGLWEDPPRLINGPSQCPRGAHQPPTTTIRQVSKASGHTWVFYWVWGNQEARQLVTLLTNVGRGLFTTSEGAEVCMSVCCFFFLSFSFWLRWVFVASFSSCGEQGLFLVGILGLLIVVASLVTEHRL